MTRTEPLLLRGGTVFDGHTSLGVRDVLIDGDRIVAVDEGIAVSNEQRVVDCHGHTVMPGLIDAHVHLAWAGLEGPPADVAASRARAVRNAALLLQAGVTTVRDVGGPLEVLAPVAADIERGDVPGPAVLYCGRILCAPGGHGTEIPLPVTIARECDGPEGFRRGVREQLAGGARVIKVALNGADGAVQLTEEELSAVVDEAHTSGVRVACHASVRAAVALAVACRVDTIEHGNGLDLALAREMADNGIGLVPTVAIFTELQQQLDDADDHMLTREQLTAHRCAVRQRVDEHAPALAAATEAGVTLGLGTDRVPGGEVVAVLAEARALLGHGLSPVQVLEAATAGNASLLGLDDRGVLRVGARADVVVLPGDVTADVELLQQPTLVLQAGRPAPTPAGPARVRGSRPAARPTTARH